MPICPKCGAPSHSLMGHEEPGIHDGVLWWHCTGCFHAWHGWPADHRRAAIADSYVHAFLTGTEAENAATESKGTP